MLVMLHWNQPSLFVTKIDRWGMKTGGRYVMEFQEPTAMAIEDCPRDDVSYNNE